MIQQFINREKELEFLEKHYNSPHSELIIIYGRRRIGKTELITQFMKGKPSIYLLATYKPINETIKELQNKMAKLLESNLFRKLSIDSFEDLFSEFFNFLEKTQKIRQKVIICIDEFPNLIQRDRGILTIFQKIWDIYTKSKNIMLILSGSSISMMETEVLGYKSPLYGRRTGQWLVDEFHINALKLYFKNYDNKTIIETYGVIGGVPGYIVKFSPEKSLRENIREKILTRGEFLYSEPEILLREELRDPTNYFLILKAIASGKNTFGKIVEATNLDKSLVSKYLSVLQNLRIVKRDVPIFSSVKEQIKPKRGHYKILDNFFNFWLNYVYPFKSELEINNLEYVLHYLDKTFNTYMGFAFEELIKKPYIARKIVPFHYTNIGSWWYKDKEIDLIAINEHEKRIFFLEVKWSILSPSDTKKIIRRLIDKANYITWNEESRKEYYGIVALDILQKENVSLDNAFLYTVDDIVSQN